MILRVGDRLIARHRRRHRRTVHPEGFLVTSISKDDGYLLYEAYKSAGEKLGMKVILSDYANEDNGNIIPNRSAIVITGEVLDDLSEFYRIAKDIIGNDK